MGKGDKKTAKGKRFKGSFGNVRPHRKKKKSITPAVLTAELSTAGAEGVAAEAKAVKGSAAAAKTLEITAEKTKKGPARKKKTEDKKKEE